MALDRPRLRRLDERVRLAACLAQTSRTGASLWTKVASELSRELGHDDAFEELDAELSSPTLDALLDRIAMLRARAFKGAAPASEVPPVGRFLIHRFGCSLETGEAEVASRHFYDVRDRPPTALWLETLTRSRSEGSGDFEVGLLAFVPALDLERAEAGRRACSNGSLAFADEFDGDLAAQLAAVLG
jgi:hypothetical protein